MNIIITGTGFSFPDGTGATSRVVDIARGFLSNGATVNVVCPKPTENTQTGDRNKYLYGEYEGIEYEYTAGCRLVAKTRVGALYLYLKGLINAFLKIKRMHDSKTVDAILLWYAEMPLNFFVFYFLSRLIGAVLISEKSEYPFVYSKETVGKRLMRKFYERVVLKKVDGVIVISSFLKRYVERYVDDESRVLLIPIMVDSQLFLASKDGQEKKIKKIIYCGGWGHESEVCNLLRVFGEVSKKNSGWLLEIIGPLNYEQKNEDIKAIVDRYQIKEKIVFRGFIEHSKMPAALADGDVMVLIRKSGTFSEAGLPTKLAEYLSTGKPVVVNVNGDIDKYLIDNYHAYLVFSDSIEEFTARLEYVIANYEEAYKVGQNGRMVAVQMFDSNIQVKKIIAYVDRLKLKRIG